MIYHFEGNEMKKVKFEDVKQVILDALTEKDPKLFPEDEYIIDPNFTFMPVNETINENMDFNGPHAALISVTGKNFGVRHLFNLRHLLPDISERIK